MIHTSGCGCSERRQVEVEIARGAAADVAAAVAVARGEQIDYEPAEIWGTLVKGGDRRATLDSLHGDEDPEIHELLGGD